MMRYYFVLFILFIILIVDASRASAQTATPYARPYLPRPSLRANDPWTDPIRAPFLAALRQTALADPDAYIRGVAIGHFGESHRNQDLLFAALRDPDPRVWGQALEFLWIDRRINSTFASDLTAHLSHPDRDVRGMAALALRDVAPWVVPETLPRLAALLLDRDAGVREAAIYALEAYGEAAAAVALPVLEGPPASKRDDGWLRRIALAVWRIAPRHPDPAAWLLLQPPDWANDEALSRAVVGLATGSGIDIGPGLGWIVANGPETVWPRTLPVTDTWGDNGLRIWLNPEPLEAMQMVPARSMPVFGPQRVADVRGLSAALLARISDPRMDPELRTMAVNAIGHLGLGAQAEVPALRQLGEAENDLLRRLEFEAAILRIQPDEPTAVARLWTAVTGDDPDLGQIATELLYDAIPGGSRIGPELGSRILAALGNGDTRLIERVFPVALTVGFPLTEPVAQRLFPAVLDRVKNAQPSAISETLRRVWALAPFVTQEQGEMIVRMLLQRLGDRKPTIHLAVLPSVVREIDWVPPSNLVINGAPSEPFLPSLAKYTRSARRSLELENEVLKSLLRCLSDPEPSLRQATLMALPNSFCVNVQRQGAFFDALAERLEDEQKIRSLALDRLVSPVRTRLRSLGVPPMSVGAWNTLLDRLDARLRSKDMTARLEAIGVLTKLCGEEWLPYPFGQEALVHIPPSPESLEELRNREATRRLVVALDGSDPATRRVAAVAILNVGFNRKRDTRPLEAAWQALRAEEKDPFILSKFAIEMERVMGETPVTLDLWRRALTAPDPAVDRTPQNPPPLPRQYQEFYFPARPGLCRTLADEYLAQLQGDDVTLRRNAARALRRLAPGLDERQALTLLRFLNDPDDQVRRDVHDALWEWTSPSARIAPAPQAPFQLVNRYQLWPPPPGTVPVPLKDKCPGMKDRRWEEVVERLASELLKKYDFIYHFAAPEIGHDRASHDGLALAEGTPDLSASLLALLTEIEPVRPDGSRLPYAERGTGLSKVRPKPPKTWGDFLRQLIGKPSGRYRMILFVLKPTRGLPPNKKDPDWDNGRADSQALNPFGWSPARDVETIQNALPAAMRGLPVGDGNVWVVFFDIERHRGGTLKPIPLGDNWFKTIYDSDLDSLLGLWPAPATMGGSGR